MVLRRVWSETLSGLLLLLAMLELAFAWGIGVSRFRDNRHHPSDIVGE
jgi:membrane-associated phospholipid phosphatase